MTEPSQLFTDEQQSMIIEDMCVLLKIYSRLLSLFVLKQYLFENFLMKIL